MDIFGLGCLDAEVRSLLQLDTAKGEATLFEATKSYFFPEAYSVEHENSHPLLQCHHQHEYR